MRKFNADHIPIPQHNPRFPQNRGALHLEIGAGVGKHALGFAESNKESYLVALERTMAKFNKFYRAYEQAGCPNNLLPIHADAIHWLVHNVNQPSFHSIFILYPNPEPKNKNQRWIHSPAFGFLWDLLLPAGKLYLASNLPHYIEEFYQGARENWQIHKRRRYPIAKGSDRSHFEAKYLKRGDVCQEVELQK